MNWSDFFRRNLIESLPYFIRFFDFCFTFLDQLDLTGRSYTFEEWFRAITLIFDAICFLDPRASINGITFIMDAAGVTMRHLMFFGFENSRKQFQVMQVVFQYSQKYTSKCLLLKHNIW